MLHWVTGTKVEKPLARGFMLIRLGAGLYVAVAVGIRDFTFL